MKKTTLSGLIATLFVATLTLPVAAETASAQNIAVVNGKAIPKSRADALTKQVQASGRPMTPEIEKQIKDELIAREVFVQAAQKQGLEGTEEYKTQLELAKQGILIRELFVSHQKKNPIGDDQVKAEYDRFVAASSGKEFKVRHILVEKESDAKDIIAKIKKGGKFEEIAKKQSKDPGSAAKGGDLDWAGPANYVPEFTEAMTKLKKGQMTDAPVKTQFGFHVIRVDDERDAVLPKLEDIKPQILQQLQQQQLQKYQEELRTAAKIE